MSDSTTYSQLPFHFYGLYGRSAGFTLDRSYDLSNLKFERINLIDFSEILINGGVTTVQVGGGFRKLKSPYREHIFFEEVFDEYIFDYAYSNVLDFSNNSEINTLSTLTRGIPVKVGRLGQEQPKPKYVPNKTFVSDKLAHEETNDESYTLKDFDKYSELYKVTYDVMLLISNKETIYLESFRHRMFDFFLPPGIVSMSSDKKQETRGSFILIPYFSIIEKATTKKDRFNSTVTISYLLIPTSDDYRKRRETSIKEINGISEATMTLSESPLKDFLLEISRNNIFSDSPRIAETIISDINEEIFVDRIIELIFFVLYVLLNKSVNKEEFYVKDHELIDSIQNLTLLSVDAGTLNSKVINEMALFYRNSKDSEIVRNLLSDLIVPTNKLEIEERGDTVDFSSLCINDPSYLDINTMSFYNPKRKTVTSFQINNLERFPLFSIKLALPWNMRLIQSISSLISIKDSYNYLLDKTLPSYTELSELEERMLRELDDLYDLNVKKRFYTYKAEFEKARRLLGIDQDFDRLKDKTTEIRDIINSSRQIKLEELQVDLNNKVGRLTIWLVVVTMVLTILTGVLILLKIFNL